MIALLYFALFISSTFSIDTFSYFDFNVSENLQLNGDCFISCDDKSDCQNPASEYSQQFFRINDTEERTKEEYRYSDNTFARQTVEWEKTRDDQQLQEEIYERLNSDDKAFFKLNKKSLRLTLTAAKRNQVSSVMYQTGLNLLQGFKVRFTFQIRNSSTFCEDKFSISGKRVQEKRCQVESGEGFSFIIHADTNRSKTLGGPDEGLGFEGIRSALVVSFEHRLKKGQHVGNFENIKVSASLHGEKVTVDMNDTIIYPITAKNNAELESLMFRNYTDDDIEKSIEKIKLTFGSRHFAKIEYFPFIRYDLLRYYDYTPSVDKFLSGTKSPGTLVVTFDGNEPITMTLLDLSRIIGNNGESVVGFTASTSKYFAKQEIISWCFEDNVNAREEEYNSSAAKQNVFNKFPPVQH